MGIVGTCPRHDEEVIEGVREPFGTIGRHHDKKVRNSTATEVREWPLQNQPDQAPPFPHHALVQTSQLSVSHVLTMSDYTFMPACMSHYIPNSYLTNAP